MHYIAHQTMIIINLYHLQSLIFAVADRILNEIFRVVFCLLIQVLASIRRSSVDFESIFFILIDFELDFFFYFNLD